MTNEELKMLKAADTLDLRSNVQTTAEMIVDYFRGVFDIKVEEMDEDVVLDIISKSVLSAYKTGSDTTEALVKDEVGQTEIIDAEFTIIEVQ